MSIHYVLHTTPTSAILWSLVLSATFVASLHFWRCLGFEDHNRNNPATIKRRFVSTLCSCIVGALLIFFLSERAKGTSNELRMSYAEFLALSSTDILRACLCCLATSATIFLGPIVQHLLNYYEGYVPLHSADTTIQTIRNLVLAPMTEELFFRACLIRLWDSAGYSATFICAGSPWFFALAHTHHFIEHVRNHADRCVAFAQVAFQVFYTCLFGMYASFLLLRTGSTVAVILTHSFCNLQGFPDVGVFADKNHDLRRHWRMLATLYVIGLVGFLCLLEPLTRNFNPPYNCMRTIE